MFKTRMLKYILEQSGFKMIRSSKHMIYRKDKLNVVVPHSKTCAKGLFHSVLKRAGIDYRKFV